MLHVVLTCNIQHATCNMAATLLMLHVYYTLLVGTGPSYIALGGALIPTGSALPVHPPPTGQTPAMHAAADTGGAVAADVVTAGAAADTLSAGANTVGKAADTASAAAAVSAEVTIARADPVAADNVTTGVAVDTADVSPAGMTTAVAGNTTDAVLAEMTTTAAVPATVDAAITGGTIGKVATAGAVAGKMNLVTQIADQTAGDGAAATGAVAARPQVHNTVSHVAGCSQPASMAYGRHTGTPAAFVAAPAFTGAQAGMLFKAGDQGLGYYADTLVALGQRPEVTPVVQPLQRAAPSEAECRCGATSLDARELKWHCNNADVCPEVLSAMMYTDSTAAHTDKVSSVVSCDKVGMKEGLPGGNVLQAGQREGKAAEGNLQARDAAEADGQVKGEGIDGEADRGTKGGHYWGQALQYLDRSVQVCHPF